MIKRESVQFRNLFLRFEPERIILIYVDFEAISVLTQILGPLLQVLQV